MKRHVNKTCFLTGLKSQAGMSSFQGCFVVLLRHDSINIDETSDSSCNSGKFFFLSVIIVH